MKKVKKKTTKKVSNISNTELELPIFQQVIGWSVHGEMVGRLGPLFTNHQGKLFYLDAISMKGFVSLSPEDKAYIDQ